LELEALGPEALVLGPEALVLGPEELVLGLETALAGLGVELAVVLGQLHNRYRSGTFSSGRYYRRLRSSLQDSCRMYPCRRICSNSTLG